MHAVTCNLLQNRGTLNILLVILCVLYVSACVYVYNYISDWMCKKRVVYMCVCMQVFMPVEQKSA